MKTKEQQNKKSKKEKKNWRTCFDMIHVLPVHQFKPSILRKKMVCVYYNLHFHYTIRLFFFFFIFAHIIGTWQRPLSNIYVTKKKPKQNKKRLWWFNECE